MSKFTFQAEPPVYGLLEPEFGTFWIDPNTQLPFYTYHRQVAELVRYMKATHTEVVLVAEYLKSKQQLEYPWSKDISTELTTNTGPYTSTKLQESNGWWQRSLNQIDGLTFHHTLSDSPHATAQHYVTKNGGRPTIPYTIWITQTGEILLCVNLQQGLWHDHTGHENVHLSVGLAGKLHKHEPSNAQLDAAAKVAVWSVKSSMLPGIVSIDDIKGHKDYTATICPGWQSDNSGNWKDDIYERIEVALENSS
jgi:hypothetical protein